MTLGILGTIKHNLLMKKLLLLGAAVMMMAACQNDVDTTEQTANGGVTASVAEYVTDEAGTRTNFNIEWGKSVNFTWSAKDYLTFYDQNDPTVVMNKWVQSGAGTNVAVLSGSTILQANHTFRAVYPGDANQQEPKVVANLAGQTQTGNDSYAHLSQYDYLVSQLVTPAVDNQAGFKMSHVGQILRIEADLPAADTYTQVTVATADGSNLFATTATLDLFGSDLIVNGTLTNSLSLDLNGVTTTGADKLVAYMMALPAKVANVPLRITVKSQTGNNDVTFTCTPKNDFRSGHATLLKADEATEWVDMNTGDGMLWRTRNIGAENPQDYGSYFIWGETWAYDNRSFDKDDLMVSGYTSSGDLDTQNSNFDMTCKIRGTNLLSNYNWVTPNKTNWENLINKARSKEIVTYRNVRCLKITATNGNVLYLPLAGNINTDNDTNAALGQQGAYWTSVFNGYNTRSYNPYTNTYLTEKTRNAIIYYFNDASPVNITSGYQQCWTGIPIRPVIKASDAIK